MSISEKYDYENKSCCVSEGDHAKFVFSGRKKQNLLNVDDLKSICDLEETVIADFFDPDCPSHSIPFYIAANRDKNCSSLDQEDVLEFVALLQDCYKYYESEELVEDCSIQNCFRIPKKCYKNNAVYKSFRFLLDVDFRATLQDPEPFLQTTMLLLQDSYSTDTIQEFYRTKVEDQELQSGDVELAAMEIGYTFDLFREIMIAELYLFAIALLLIGIVMYMYLGSGTLVFATFMNVLFSFWVGYAVYHIIFGFDFFGFTNIMTMLLLIAIGADDVFIFADSWEEARLSLYSMKSSKANDQEIIIQNDELAKASANMEQDEPNNVNAGHNDLIYSIELTPNNQYSAQNDTSKASNPTEESTKADQVSEDDKPAAGSKCSNVEHPPEASHFENPAQISESDLEYLVTETFHHASKSILITSFTTGFAMFANFLSKITVIRCFGIFTMTCILINFVLMVTWVPCLMVIHERSSAGRKCCSQRSSCRAWVEFKMKVSRGLRKFYGELLPRFITKFLYPLIIFFTLGGISGIIVVFVNPKFQLPSTTYFPMFVGDHPFEVYNRDMRDRFEFSNPLLDSGNGMEVYFTWGVTPVDNGDWLNAFSRGYLVLESFDYSSPEAQEFLVNFCESLKNESFIAKSMLDIECSYSAHWEILKGECFYPVFNASISPCCQSQTPVADPRFSTCLPYCIVANGLKYGPTIGYHIFDADNNVEAFVMNLTSNRPLSAVFSIMQEFYEELDVFTREAMKTAPVGLQQGWFYSFFDFYDLQANLVQGTYISMFLSMLIALFFLLVTTWSGWISAYSIIVIFFCIQVVIACLVGMGWQLNIVESATVTLAVGLSIDFTIHYGVAYIQSEEKTRAGKVQEALIRVGSSVSMAAFTTFVAGAAMMPARLIAYRQFSSFLMIVVVMSWLYATFLLLPVCQLIGPPLCVKESQDPDPDSDRDAKTFYDAYAETELDVETLPPESTPANSTNSNAEMDDETQSTRGETSMGNFTTQNSSLNTTQMSGTCNRGFEGSEQNGDTKTHINFVPDEDYCTSF